MYACPNCAEPVHDFELRCSACLSDVKIMACLAELPDAQFNAALRASRRGDWGTALHWLGSVLAARTSDAEAWYLTGLIYARRGTLDMARDCWQMVRFIRPDDERAIRALGILERAREGQTTTSGG